MSGRNPRFPHKLVVKRARRIDGEIIYDDEGNVTYDIVPLSPCVLDNRGYMRFGSDGKPLTSDATDSIKCGYRTSTRNVSESGDVAVYNITLHTPPFTTELLYDDLLVITDYERTYTARMVRKVTFNWGTNIWFDEIRN